MRMLLSLLLLAGAAHAGCDPSLTYTTTPRLALPRPTINQCNWAAPVQALIDRLDQYACLPGVAPCGTTGSTLTDGQVLFVQGGAFAGDAAFTFDSVNKVLHVDGFQIDVAGTEAFFLVPPGTNGLIIDRDDGHQLHRFGTKAGETGFEIRQTDDAMTGAMLHVFTLAGELEAGIDEQGRYFQQNTAIGPGTQPAIRLSDTGDGGQVEFGPGGSGAPDLAIYRKAGAYLGVFGGKLELEQGIQVRTSVLSSSGMQHKRQSTGTITAGATSAVTVVWPVAFADINYTAACTVESATAGSGTLEAMHIRTKNVSNMAVDVKNGNAANDSGTLDCIAMHD